MALKGKFNNVPCMQTKVAMMDSELLANVCFLLLGVPAKGLAYKTVPEVGQEQNFVELQQKMEKL